MAGVTTRGPGLTLTAPEIAWLVLEETAMKGETAALAVAIALAESGGVTNIVRPASMNPSGGDDRGLWQINSKAHPRYSDAEVLTPIIAVNVMSAISDGGKNFGPWNVGPKAYGGPSADRTRSLPLAVARSAVAAPVDPRPRMKAAGLDVDSSPSLGDFAGAVGDRVGDVVGALTPYDEIIGLGSKALRLLTSAEFWRRAGLVVLGAALIVAGIVFLARDLLPTSAAAGALSKG